MTLLKSKQLNKQTNMKLFQISKDGGQNSTVTGLFIIECKALFSISILKFNKGSRENFHSHAFNAYTFWLPGADVTEHHTDGRSINWKFGFKTTPKSCFHKIYAHKDSFAVSVRGPWDKTWKEYSPSQDKTITMTNHRVVTNVADGLH